MLFYLIDVRLLSGCTDFAAYTPFSKCCYTYKFLRTHRRNKNIVRSECSLKFMCRICKRIDKKFLFERPRLKISKIV